MASVDEEQEEVSILEKILKILVVVVGLSILYSYAEPILSELTANAQRDRVTRDFAIVADAISRFELQSGKKYTDTSLQGLVDKKLIEELPKDPWGSEYVYSWFVDELITPGPNRVLNTFVPILHNEATEPENDDRIKNVTLTTRLLYPYNSGGIGHIGRGDIDGSSFSTLEEVPGEIQGLSVLPASKIVVYSLKRGNSYDLRTYDFGTSARQDLTTDAAQDLNPVWASQKHDLIVFQSDREAPGVFSLFQMQLPEKTITKLVDRPGEDPSPGVDLHERKLVYFASRLNDRPAIRSITLPDTRPLDIVSGRGILLRPSPSPTGTYLAYLVQEATGTAIEVIETRSKKLIFRKDGASPKGWIAWSPEGDKLAYQIEEKGQARIVLAHPPSGRTVVHPQFVMALGRFAWIK